MAHIFCILSAYDLPDSEFDTCIRTILTRRHKKETLGNPNTYTILQPSTDFDFLDDHCSYYDIEFRIVRIRLDNGTYICIATNLPEENFPLEEIKKQNAAIAHKLSGGQPVDLVADVEHAVNYAKVTLNPEEPLVISKPAKTEVKPEAKPTDDGFDDFK